MKKRPYLFLIIGITFLLVPTVVYLAFLTPLLTEEYNMLITSGGVIGGVGYFASSKIPETFKYSGLFKMASNSFTTLIIATLVKDFIMEIIFLVVTIVLSIIVFRIFLELFRYYRRRLENADLAETISRNLAKNS